MECRVKVKPPRTETSRYGAKLKSSVRWMTLILGAHISWGNAKRPISSPSHYSLSIERNEMYKNPRRKGDIYYNERPDSWLPSPIFRFWGLNFGTCFELLFPRQSFVLTWIFLATPKFSGPNVIRLFLLWNRSKRAQKILKKQMSKNNCRPPVISLCPCNRKHYA